MRSDKEWQDALALPTDDPKRNKTLNDLNKQYSLTKNSFKSAANDAGIAMRRNDIGTHKA